MASKPQRTRFNQVGIRPQPRVGLAGGIVDGEDGFKESPCLLRNSGYDIFLKWLIHSNYNHFSPLYFVHGLNFLQEPTQIRERVHLPSAAAPRSWPLSSPARAALSSPNTGKAPLSKMDNRQVMKNCVLNTKTCRLAGLAGNY